MKHRILATTIAVIIISTASAGVYFSLRANPAKQKTQSPNVATASNSDTSTAKSTSTSPSSPDTPASTTQPKNPSTPNPKTPTPKKSPTPTTPSPTSPTAPTPSPSPAPTVPSGKVCGSVGYNAGATLPSFQSKYPSFWRTDYQFADLYDAPSGVFENFSLKTGAIFIKSNATQLRNFYLRTSSDYYPIRTDSREAGTGSTISHATIAGYNATDDSLIKGITAWSNGLTIDNVDISGTHDGVTVGADNITISNTCIHDLALTPNSHNDGVEIYGGSNITIRNSEIKNPHGQTSAINITNDGGPISNVLIENVRLSGGGYTIYVRGDGASGAAVSNIRFRNVVIDSSGYYGPVSYQGAPGAIVEWDVKYANGAPVPRP